LEPVRALLQVQCFLALAPVRAPLLAQSPAASSALLLEAINIIAIPADIVIMSTNMGRHITTRM
jgi:hypothetical protein